MTQKRYAKNSRRTDRRGSGGRARDGYYGPEERRGFEDDGYYEDDRYYEGDRYNEDDRYYDNDSYYDNGRDFEDRHPASGRSRYTKSRSYEYDDQYYRDREYYRDDTPADYLGSDRHSSYTGRPERPRKRRHPVRTFFVTLLVLLLILGGAAYAVLHFGILGRMRSLPSLTTDGGTEGSGTEFLTGTSAGKLSGVTNILLIGQDARTGEEQTRSDTMILCSINSDKNRITLVSLMRDMYVPIPGYGSDRLNAAYAYGGVELLDAAVSEDFQVWIDGNATVDLDGFLTAMTSVGDLEIDLTQEEADFLNANGNIGFADDYTSASWNLTAGTNVMTPNQVLAYCRMRGVGNSDWDRTERQRKVLMLAFEKLRSSDPITQMNVLQQISPSIATDMSQGTLIKTAVSGLLGGGNEIRNYILPAEGTYYADNIDGMDVLVPDLEENARLLRQYLSE